MILFKSIDGAEWTVDMSLNDFHNRLENCIKVPARRVLDKLDGYVFIKYIVWYGAIE